MATHLMHDCMLHSILLLGSSVPPALLRLGSGLCGMAGTGCLRLLQAFYLTLSHEAESTRVVCSAMMSSCSSEGDELTYINC